MQRVWEWCLRWLPEEQAHRFLVITVVVSVLLHVLAGIALITGGNIEQRRIVSKRGEALLVDIAPDKPKETAPLGDPSRHVGPIAPEPPRPAAPPTPPPPKAAPAPPPSAAPRLAEAPRATPKAPPAPPQSAEPGPAPKVAPAQPAPEPESQTARAAPQPQPQPSAPAANPRVASVPPQPPPAAAMFRRGGGGGLKGGRGGIEGEAIPLDTPEPKFQDYFNQIRERIKSKWIYPYEASSRGIEGELQIEFGIAKSGELQFIEKRASSGIELLDDYAMRAVQLASPFPPVPDALSKGGIPINGIFRYHILTGGMINNYLR
jgi:TonB family protein